MVDRPAVATSADVAGAALGVGAAEAERRVLGATAERRLVVAELVALAEAEEAYAAAGDAERATAASAGARVLHEVLDSVPGHVCGDLPGDRSDTSPGRVGDPAPS